MYLDWFEKVSLDGKEDNDSFSYRKGILCEILQQRTFIRYLSDYDIKHLIKYLKYIRKMNRRFRRLNLL